MLHVGEPDNIIQATLTAPLPNNDLYSTYHAPIARHCLRWSGLKIGAQKARGSRTSFCSTPEPHLNLPIAYLARHEASHEYLFFAAFPSKYPTHLYHKHDPSSAVLEVVHWLAAVTWL